MTEQWERERETFYLAGAQTGDSGCALAMRSAIVGRVWSDPREGLLRVGGG